MDPRATFSHVIQAEMMHVSSHTIATFAVYRICPANVACTHTSADGVISSDWPTNHSMRICFVHHYIGPIKVCCRCRYCCMNRHQKQTQSQFSLSLCRTLCFNYSNVRICLNHALNQLSSRNGNCTRRTGTTRFRR